MECYQEMIDPVHLRNSYSWKCSERFIFVRNYLQLNFFQRFTQAINTVEC